MGVDNHDLYMTSHLTVPSATAKKQQLDIVVLGGLGGRVDQGFSQVHHLYAAYEEKRQSTATAPTSQAQAGDLYLLSEESLSFILPPGVNVIHTPLTHQQIPNHHYDEEEKGKFVFSENVGIIPLSGPTLITLTGFEWDVKRWHTEIGGQLSTSNHIRADRLEVDVDVDINRAVLFSVELGERFKRVVAS